MEIKISEYFNWNLNFMTFYDHLEQYLALGFIPSTDKLNYPAQPPPGFEQKNALNSPTMGRERPKMPNQMAALQQGGGKMLERPISQMPEQEKPMFMMAMEKRMISLALKMIDEYHTDPRRQKEMAYLIICASRKTNFLKDPDSRFLRDMYGLKIQDDRRFAQELESLMRNCPPTQGQLMFDFAVRHYDKEGNEVPPPGMMPPPGAKMPPGARPPGMPGMPPQGGPMPPGAQGMPQRQAQGHMQAMARQQGNRSVEQNLKYRTQPGPGQQRKFQSASKNIVSAHNIQGKQQPHSHANAHAKFSSSYASLQHLPQNKLRGSGHLKQNYGTVQAGPTKISSPQKKGQRVNVPIKGTPPKASENVKDSFYQRLSQNGPVPLPKNPYIKEVPQLNERSSGYFGEGKGSESKANGAGGDVIYSRKINVSSSKKHNQNIGSSAQIDVSNLKKMDSNQAKKILSNKSRHVIHKAQFDKVIRSSDYKKDMTSSQQHQGGSGYTKIQSKLVDPNRHRRSNNDKSSTNPNTKRNQIPQNLNFYAEQPSSDPYRRSSVDLPRRSGPARSGEGNAIKLIDNFNYKIDKKKFMRPKGVLPSHAYSKGYTRKAATRENSREKKKVTNLVKYPGDVKRGAPMAGKPANGYFQRRSQNSHMSSVGDLSHMNAYKGRPGRPITNGKASLGMISSGTRGQRISNTVRLSLSYL